MIKRIIVFLICIVLGNLSSFYKEIENVYVELDKFESYVNKYGINYELMEEMRVVFDYESIDYYLENDMNKALKEEISRTNFIVLIEVRNGIFYKSIREEFVIRKGDYYDGRN